MENNKIEMEIKEEVVTNDTIENEENETETVEADDVIIVEPVEEGFNCGPLVAGALAALGCALAWIAYRKGKKTADERYEELKQEMMREAAKRGETVTFEKVEGDSDVDSEEVESDEDNED